LLTKFKAIKASVKLAILVNLIVKSNSGAAVPVAINYVVQ